MLKLIGAGFGRTGTLSLKTALEQIGFGPCYHMAELIDNPERMAHWTPIIEGKKPDWEHIFAGYPATVDWPAAAYWRELVAAYPDAKVLLSVRDPQKWYDSVDNTIYYVYKLMRDPSQLPPAMQERFASQSPGERMRLLQELIWDGTFQGRFEDRDFAVSVFEKHNQQVIDAVPADRLLVYQVGQGWGPLCDFLGVPVPDGDFPRVNEGTEFRARITEGLTPADPH
ncbi:sulfotransferase family protein [Fodinicola feengrottensis]|uniref:Sulfotransferase family protein n=1 Tax=Fodinicola feengrottensis TaxID=435914 RepID=A0ABN2FXF4_9ACTN|nr:sulfotransferase family protein [Fodinicola feengrottensis]